MGDSSSENRHCKIELIIIWTYNSFQIEFPFRAIFVSFEKLFIEVSILHVGVVSWIR